MSTHKSADETKNETKEKRKGEEGRRGANGEKKSWRPYAHYSLLATNCRRVGIMAMMDITRRQSFGQDAPHPTPSHPTPRARVGDVNGQCHGGNHPVSHYRSTRHRVMLFPHENLRPALDSSEPSAGLSCSLAPCFGLR